MLRFTIAFIVVTLFLGCTSKQESDLMQAYNEKIMYHKQLQKTEKIQLYEGKVTKAMLTATYLHKQNFEKKDKQDEVFIVGVQLEDEALGGIDGGEYSLTLNGHVAKETVALDVSDERLKEISIVTDWGNYYLITFPHVENKKLTLVFKSKMYGQGALYFAKVAKYVLSKKAF